MTAKAKTHAQKLLATALLMALEDLPDKDAYTPPDFKLPEGFEYAGECRAPRKGEWFLTNWDAKGQHIRCTSQPDLNNVEWLDKNMCRHILRKLPAPQPPASTPSPEVKELVEALRSTMRTLEPVARNGWLSQGGEQRGNWLDIVDTYRKLERLAKKYTLQ